MAEPFIGEIKIFAGNFPPRGWAFCAGQLLPISTNTALFSIIGTTYGGDGRTTFALPDLRGRAPIGFGQGPGLSDYREGQKGGAELTTLTVNNMPSHTHTATLTATSHLEVSTDAATTNTPGVDTCLAQGLAAKGRESLGEANIYSAAVPNSTMNSIVTTGTITNLNAGGSQPFDNRQPYIAMNYIIALVGLFPSRN